VLNLPALVCPDVVAGSLAAPKLIGGRCRACGEPFFPTAASCTRCSHTELERIELGDRGTLWSWTIQMFPPKAPYDGTPVAQGFIPYGVGYVELPNGLKVESRLIERDAGFSIGQPMRLILQPYRRNADGSEVFTYAFEPAE
jgi:uncharacterized protein